MRIRVALPIVCLGLLACFGAVPLHMGEPSSPRALKRGKELVDGIAACGFCHGEKASPDALLSGGQELEDRYGTVIAPNLTPDATGIRTWSTRELVRVLRNSVDRDDNAISKDWHAYDWMSDADLLAIVSYLRTLPAVPGPAERRTLGFIDRNLTGFSESWRTYDNYVPEISKRDSQAYGRYLSDNVANCNGCHLSPAGWFSSEEYLAGGKVQQGPAGELVAPALAGTEVEGLKGWSESDIVLYLQAGQKPDGSFANGAYCPFPFYARAPEEELFAIASYLKSLP